MMRRTVKASLPLGKIISSSVFMYVNLIIDVCFYEVP